MPIHVNLRSFFDVFLLPILLIHRKLTYLPPLLTQKQGFDPKNQLISVTRYFNVGNYKEGFEKRDIVNPIFLQVVYELGTFSNFY